jgi:hypothetical protein
MKAWRLEASKINARRKAGSNEPSARVQKALHSKQPVILGSTWLLDGLFIRVGIVDPLPNPTRNLVHRPLPRHSSISARKSWALSFKAFLKRMFS